MLRPTPYAYRETTSAASEQHRWRRKSGRLRDRQQDATHSRLNEVLLVASSRFKLTTDLRRNPIAKTEEPRLYSRVSFFSHDRQETLSHLCHFTHRRSGLEPSSRARL